MKKLTVAGLSLLATVVTAVPVNATESIFLVLTGQKSGVIKGEVTQKGRENQIEVLRLEFGASVPVAAGSGQVTGKRVWSTVKILKRLDRASPSILNLLVTNESISSAVFRVWRPAQSAQVGLEEQYYTVKLTNASVVSDTVIAPGDKDAATIGPIQGSVEQLALTFQKIEVTYPSTNTTASDDLSAR